MKTASTILAAATLAAGCRVTPDYARPTPELPASFAEAPANTGAPAGEPAASAANTSENLARWWTRLGDARLSALVERSLAENLDLRAARARVLAARAVFDQARGAQGPSLDARAGAAWRESSTTLGNGPFADPDPTSFHEVGFDASWEVDLFGRNARASEAALAGAEAAEEDLSAVRVTLCAEVARQYVELRAAQRGLELTRANLAAQEETLALVRVRAAAELASDLDVARAETQAATTRSALPQYEVRAASAVHALALLTARAPADVAAELRAVPNAAIPSVPAVDAPGTPADLLLARPDVRRAERELARAAALDAVARAELFPRISLGAALGLQSRDLSDLLDVDSRAFSVGPGLVAPLFHSGALRANVRVQEARQAEALARYEAAAIGALREVEDALVASERESARIAALTSARDSAQRARALAADMQRTGLADFFDVLDAERSVLAADTSLAESEARLATSRIALYKALGGGWGPNTGEGELPRGQAGPR